jgi:hypothetical protein
MAELKTRRTNASVGAFLKKVDASRREDCEALVRIMKRATGAEPKMWGPSIVGFGDYQYKYASGREGDWFLVGFSPRARDLTLYLMAGVDRFPELRARLGKHTLGKSCLYIKRLDDVDVKTLGELVDASVRYSKQHEAT